MLILKKVAVTGGVAAGKSTACQIFKELGAFVLSADDIVHQILTPETEAGKKVIALLGHDIVVNGNIQRDKIAQIVFQNKSLLEALERILHPEVHKIIDLSYNENIQKKKHFPLFIVEVPLLFEVHLEGYYDIVLLIRSETGYRINRFMEKGFSLSEFESRQGRFLSDADKAERSHYVIENNGTYKDFRNSLTKLYQELIKEI